MWRDTSDYFEKKNVEVINQIIRTRPLGSSKSSINAMLRNTEEMKAIMPLILGQGHAGGQDQSFANAVANYWNSMSYRIPFPSQTWEIGFTFDSQDSDPLRKEYIEKLAIVLGKTKVNKARAEARANKTEVSDDIELTMTDEELADYVMGTDKDGKPNIPVEQMFRYGTPIDPSQFLLWQYSLNHGLVANTKALLKNSTKMDFYLVDETVAKKERETLHQIKNKARRAYLETIVKPDKVIDVLAVLKKDIPYDTPEDEQVMTREQLLETVMTEQPIEFLEVLNSPNLTTLAKLERYIVNGILRRLDNSNIIVDGNNPEIVIGNTTNEHLAWFANGINKNAIAEYAAQYKSLTN
jgi:hypothetical protein